MDELESQKAVVELLDDLLADMIRDGTAEDTPDERYFLAACSLYIGDCVRELTQELIHQRGGSEDDELGEKLEEILWRRSRQHPFHRRPNSD